MGQVDQNGAVSARSGASRHRRDLRLLAQHLLPPLDVLRFREVAALVLRVELREALGSEIVAHIGIDAKAALTEDVRELAEDTDAVTVGDLEDMAREGTEVIGRFNARSTAHQGDEVEVAVDTRALHFFDPETGMGIYDSKGGAPA